VNLEEAIRSLKSEKRWLDGVIASVEAFQSSKPFRAVALLDSHVSARARSNGKALSRRRRHRIYRWLQEVSRKNHNGAAGRPAPG